jgi:polyhydroxyalkanoate synthesis regulator phasin
MHKSTKRKVAAGAAAAVAIAGGGVAIGATQLGSPQQESQAVVNDAAKQLGIDPTKLSDALKTALENRIDAAVAAGTITKEQGDAMKARIESGSLPLFVPGAPHRFGFGGPGILGAAGDQLSAAADYLGLTEAQLRTQLQSGKSLADVAKAQGKTVDGLVQALYDAQKKQLDAAVKAGKLTQAQADTVLSNLKSRLTDLVNGTLPRFDRDGGGMPGFGFRRFRDFSGGPRPASGFRTA